MVPVQSRAINPVISVSSLLVGVMALFIVLGCDPNDRGRRGLSGPEVARRTTLATEPEPEPAWTYVGDESCRDCHPAEHIRYLGSGHSKTLQPAAEHPVARLLDGQTVPDPEHPDVSWRYELADGSFLVERIVGNDRESLPIDFAVGSGHHSTTFLTLIGRVSGPPGSLEHRMTYFAGDGETMRVTPGQEADARLGRSGPMGHESRPPATLRCLACHSTRLATRPGEFDREDLILNVSCERCHGPASGHVEAAHRGDLDLSMPLGFGSLASDTVASCGECHRMPEDLAPRELSPQNPQLARFQPVGLLQSACYTESPGALSCVTCHDPHARVETDPLHYQSLCLSCHTPSDAPPTPPTVNLGCIDCHMPGTDAGQGILFSDHWIRVRPDVRPDDPCTRPLSSD